MPITFSLKREPTVPLEAEVLTPDVVAELSHAEIGALTVYHGKRQLPLSDFFEIDGERSEDLVLHGSLDKVRWIGRAMSKGSVTIHGNVGMHLGAYMSGGRIEVHGHATDWIGAEMKNGFIHVHGNAGGQVGAAYRGSLGGMKDGTIIVDGTAGLEVGMRMRGGVIAIRGQARDFTGLQMKGGTIVLLNGVAVRFTMGAFQLAIDSEAVLVGCCVGLIVGLLGALPAAWRALRMPIVEGLKTV